MHRDTRVGRPRPARDEAHAGLARRLGVALRHKTGAALLAVGDQSNFGNTAQPIQKRDVTFPRHAKDMAHTLVAKTLSDSVTGDHSSSSCNFRKPFTARLLTSNGGRRQAAAAVFGIGEFQGCRSERSDTSAR